MYRRGKRYALMLVVSAGLASFRPAASVAGPYVPTDDGEVLERLPVSPLEPNERQLNELRSTLAREPDNVELAARVAWRYIEQGRALSDPRYYGYAQGALTPWWGAPDPAVPMLVLRATIRQHDHQFGRALADLSQALRADPGNAQAWLTQAIVQQVTGDFAAARQSCLQVLQLSRPLVAVICLSSVNSLNGEATKSYDALRRALARGDEADPSVRLWALTILAEIAARSGQSSQAEAHFQQALALGRADDYLTGAYADFLLDEGRAEAVRDLLHDKTRADALLLRLALAEKMLGSPDLAQHVQMLQDRFAAARMRGDCVHRREEARFALHLSAQPQIALKLAQDNWAVQREPSDARILLESALESGNYGAAEPVLSFLTRTRLEDGTLARSVAELRGSR